MNVSATSQGDVTIRRANIADVPGLSVICRESLPDSIVWRGVSWYGKNWWHVALMSEAAETYVAERDGRVAAFAVLVKNEDLWKKEKKLRHGPVGIQVLSCLVCPRLTAAAIYRKVHNLMTRTAERMTKLSATRSYHRTWLELIATRPDSRGKGLAGTLMEQCETKTKELYRKAIGLRVTSDNVPAKSLYEKHGYVCLWSDAKGEVYVKFLEK
jgi:ribosomal protein S18 acetylase RimI-like enzyme